MKVIPLTNEGETWVDDADYPLVSHLRWGKKKTPAGYWYARSTTNPRVWLHRVVTGAKRGQDVDHRSHDTLDNQQNNLRVTTRVQNQQNRLGARTDSGTGIRGVRLVTHRRKVPRYQASACLQGHTYYFGHYQTVGEAEQAAIAGRAKLMTHAEGR